MYEYQTGRTMVVWSNTQFEFSNPEVHPKKWPHKANLRSSKASMVDVAIESSKSLLTDARLKSALQACRRLGSRSFCTFLRTMSQCRGSPPKLGIEQPQMYWAAKMGCQLTEIQILYDFMIYQAQFVGICCTIPSPIHIKHLRKPWLGSMGP